ncbi:MAG TPA: Maf family protein [Candidatus Nitrosotenuis sp.]|nr:Maf family protein [Candidatus Nitrosotenuis sp.]
MRLILASSSPRRAEVLRDAGISFETVPADVNEARKKGEPAVELVLRLARAKAEAGAAKISGAAIVLGADTEVVIGGDVLGKPDGTDSARAMLRRLSGATHEVITGICLLRLPDGAARSEHEVTRVTFAPLSDAEIEAYVASGEPFDKAGGYAIQGLGGRFITRIEGCYFNVVGLPLAKVYQTLRELDVL